jgi:branched-chain amino acid aminotransferase
MGVTRQSILDLCEELGIPSEVRNIRKEELDDADEVGLMTSKSWLFNFEKPLDPDDLLYAQLLEV